MRWKKGMLIYNECAGNSKVEKALEECLPILTPQIDEFLILQTKEKGDADKFCSEYGEGMDVVFVLGGDGTVHECVNGLSPLEHRPLLGILPGGTCNDFSRTLEIPQNIRRAAETIVNGNVRMIDVGKADDHYLLNFWGIGLITDTSNNIDEQEKSKFGKIGYFLSAIRTIGDQEPFPFRVEYDETCVEGKAVMILVLNGNFIGTNSMPFSMVQPDDGLFDIVIVKESSLSVFREILAMKSSLTESVSSESGVMYIQARKLKVETELPLEVDMDGEIYNQTPTQIEVLKHHLAFLSPSSGV
ncbi:diacylglycerol/lipid kinase family protein [Peribacillus sp. NPDC046944]|uniref:diacylglycerol/lipid kinase family protein n=1 Tax=unclassified Peribacillus TaxID=2675266 RepID=UPI003D023136